jgi:ParB family chromosome partitioning protein
VTKKPALGKGLSSLLPGRTNREPDSAPPSVDEQRPAEPTSLPVQAIEVNPNQPRRAFREQQLAELADSIRQDGVIQPLVVRKLGNSYQLVAGERRLRAAKLAGLQLVPVVVQDISDERLLEVALVENIQREDLHPIELAQAFERLSKDLGLNHEEIGKRTGKDRATITNSIRLLQLPADLQELVADRKLSPGHARALLKLPSEEEQRAMAKLAVAQGWSVRAIEAASQIAQAARTRASPEESTAPDPNLASATDELERALGTKVRIAENKGGKGRIEIEYYSLDDLNRLYFYITRQD